jgi:phosphoenolpyruvate-protein phosphotransferase (PTS system enzyme I)
MKVLKVSQPASGGIAMGSVYLYQPKERKIADYRVSSEDADKEIERFEDAVLKAAEELSVLAGENPIFAAHLEMVKDATLQEAVTGKIKGEGNNAEKAVVLACEELILLFETMEDAYMKERAADIKDIRERLLSQLTGIVNKPVSCGKDSILIAPDLTPSDTSSLDLNKIRGLITRDGGVTSHVAILAKSLSLPALVGVKEILSEVTDGDYLILDGYNGEILINPTEEEKQKYHELIKKHKEAEQRIKAEESLSSITLDGREVYLCANVGNIEDIKKAVTSHIDGIGLFRSEFLYLGSSHFPTEEEQFEAYKEAAVTCSREITIRTLDIGGDKTLPYYPMDKEENPFLGFRAIRISLQEKELFKIQLRAILRASAFGKIRILFPMIISLEELRAAKAAVRECMEELKTADLSYDETIQTGVMIETPASVLCAEELAKEVDFFSIGTNDLTQYLLAVDRGNSKIATLYNSFHPAVIRSIRHVTESAHKYGKKAGMCGEFAGNEKATELLIGLGLDELSMTASLISGVRYRIRRMKYEAARKLAEEAVNKATVSEIMELL